jgi:cyanophycin synthetase
MARPGDLVVLLPTDVDAAWRQVQEFQPDPSPVQDVTPQLRAG